MRFASLERAALVAATLLVSYTAAADVPDVVAPSLVHDEGAPYPERATLDGVAAPTTVILRLLVDAHGHVADARVETPQGHGFDEAALAAARRLRFAPATRDGIPIASQIRFRYVFTPPAPTPTPTPTPAPTPTPTPTPAPAPAPAPEEVTVQGRPPPTEVAHRTLTPEETTYTPGSRGDALATLESMPGVGHAPPLSGLLILRGSGPNDTNTFVDGTGINLPYHLTGLSAVVPSEVLERLDFSPGNYEPRFGRGMGGVVEFQLRAPRSDGLHGLAQVDGIEARALAEGPIAGGWRFLAAVRRSTVDLWLDPLLTSLGGPTLVPSYYDAQVEVQKDFDARRSLRVAFFGYDDQVNLFLRNADSTVFSGGIAQHIAFAAAQLRYVDRYAPSGELRLMASVGRDVSRRVVGADYYDLEQTPITVRADLSQRIVPGAKLETGLDILDSAYSGSARAPALADPDVPSGGPAVLPLQVSAAGWRFEPGAYAQTVLDPWWGSRIAAGARVDYDDATRAWDVAPRLTVRQDVPGTPVDRRTTLKAAVGEYFQPPQLVEIVPVFGQTGLVSNRSVQGDAGIEQELSDDVDLSADAFYKWMDHLVVPGSLNSGEGRAYGVEWLLRYKPDAHFFGWIAYTLSRSERRDSSAQPYYLFDYDQTHNLSVVASWRIDDRWRVGARFRLVSGDPYTPESTGALDAGSATYQPALPLAPNGARLAAFHELDLRLDRAWTAGVVKLTAYLDVENVYNYQAPIGVAYSFDYTHTQTSGGLPILPSVGLRGEL